MEKFVWLPEKELIEKSNIWNFMQKHKIDTFEELHKKSIDNAEWFWDVLPDILAIEWEKKYETVIDKKDGLPFTHFYVGGKLNITETCLDKKIKENKGDRICVISENEEGLTKHYTYKEIYSLSNKMANALRKIGMQKGDRIGIFMPMIPELIIAFFAIIRIGAIVVPLFSGFGHHAIKTRLVDAEAKALFTVNGTKRRGKIVEMKKIADYAIKDIPLIKNVIVHNNIDLPAPFDEKTDIYFEDIMKEQSTEYNAEIMDSEGEFMIIYTSGTTGIPKGALHVHTGFPFKSAKDMFFGFDVKENDRMFWVTDIGWMMGPWEILGITILGASMFIYDGALDYPFPERLYKIIDNHKISILGISPTLVRTLMQHDEDTIKKHDLSSLRIIGSTGEPWDPDSWMFFFDKIGNRRCPVINYSGGTEISGGILLGNVLKPLKPCAFSGPVPGMDADIFDEHGKSLKGEIGELVIKSPWVGMTKAFWRDTGRYLNTYWARWQNNIWVHGDLAMTDKDGLWYILGRSDDTIKVAGKRIGPAEVESLFSFHSAVFESACIGVPDAIKGEVIISFVVLNPTFLPSDKIKEELKEIIIENLGKPFIPKDIKFVKGLPKTRNAKIMRRVIKAVYLGKDPGDLSALENPESIEELRAVS